MTGQRNIAAPNPYQASNDSVSNRATTRFCLTPGADVASFRRDYHRVTVVFLFRVKTKVTPWKVLKQRDFGFFWVSLLFSAIGTQISAVAIAWQVYQITNSPL